MTSARSLSEACAGGFALSVCKACIRDHVSFPRGMWRRVGWGRAGALQAAALRRGFAIGSCCLERSRGPLDGRLGSSRPPALGGFILVPQPLRLQRKAPRRRTGLRGAPGRAASKSRQEPRSRASPACGRSFTRQHPPRRGPVGATASRLWGGCSPPIPSTYKGAVRSRPFPLRSEPGRASVGRPPALSGQPPASPLPTRTRAQFTQRRPGGGKGCACFWR